MLRSYPYNDFRPDDTADAWDSIDLPDAAAKNSVDWDPGFFLSFSPQIDEKIARF